MNRAGPRPAAALFLASALLLHPACAPSGGDASGRERGEGAGGPAADAGKWPTGPLDALLARHVAEGRVDYGSLKADAAFGACVASLASVDTSRLSGKAEKLAFWIDAYNLLVLKGVADAYPVKSIREIGVLGRPTFFRGLKFQVGGRERTLDTIEHKILRPEFHEPRIHFALTTASLGGPALKGSAFHAEKLEEELEAAARAFISDPTKVRLDRSEGVLLVSPIFDWFGEDFDRAAGNRIDFIRRYLGEADAAFVARGDVSLRYLDFDWTLNDRIAAP